MQHFQTLAAAVFSAMALSPAGATVVLAVPTYTQDFDTLANGGTSSVLPAGWALAESGANADASYAAGNGSSNAGNTYSFGAQGSTERALGALGSGNLVPSFGVQFTNGLGAVVTDLSIAYFGELWRIGTSGNLNGLRFAYSLDATSLANGTYIGLAGLDYAIAPVGAQGARDGNTGRTAIAGTISGLSLAPGASIFLRWAGANNPGNDHGLGIDDFALTATTAAGVIPEPATWGLMIAGFGLVGFAARRRRQAIQSA